MRKNDNSKTISHLPILFRFNQEVVEVFPNMITRSVPGYHTIIDGIGRMSQKCLENNAKVYDLGCSLGAVSLSIAKYNQGKKINITAIDNSQAMVERCAMNVSAYNYDSAILVKQGDINDIVLQPCHMIVINFTLQFINPEQRQAMLDKAYQALGSGGMLVVSEKISSQNADMDALLIDLHHDFKRENGYTDLEISQKRSALEHVMITDTPETHQSRMLKAGFASASIWFQHYNFVSFCALKG